MQVDVKPLDDKYGINEKKLNADKIYQTNDIPAKGIEDMVDMENLNDAELLNNTKIRFENNDIFTFVGPTLLALNPYYLIDRLFNDSVLDHYQKNLCLDLSVNTNKDPPHIYGIAANSFKQLCRTGKNQAIVISGESGAGKTEETKLAMKFLTTLG